MSVKTGEKFSSVNPHQARAKARYVRMAVRHDRRTWRRTGLAEVVSEQLAEVDQ